MIIMMTSTTKDDNETLRNTFIKQIKLGTYLLSTSEMWKNANGLLSASNPLDCLSLPPFALVSNSFTPSVVVNIIKCICLAYAGLPLFASLCIGTN